MKPLHIGIDLGSMGLRVAYVADGSEVHSLEHVPVTDAGWLFCERSTASRLGVSFPSLKSRLGAPAQLSDDGGRSAPSQTLTAALAEVKRNVEELSGRPVAQAVICVPAFYPTSQREALHDATLAAGFAAAHLINDSVGAVTAHTAGWLSPATVLVFCAGYHGFELGLNRVVKGHVRALAYEGGWIAGAELDQRMLADILFAAEGGDGTLGEVGWGAEQWMTARAAFQDAKERLGTTDQVVFPLPPPSYRPRMTMQVRLGRLDFEDSVRNIFAPAADLVAALLRKAGMVKTDLDAVVLVGGTTRIAALQALLAETVSCVPIVAPPMSLAVGAALHAARLGSEPGPVPFEAERVVDTREAKLPATHAVSLRAAVAFIESLSDIAGFPVPATADQVTTVTDLLTPGSLKRHIDQLIRVGEGERARTELGELIREAQGVLDGLPDSGEHAVLSPTSPAYRSQLALSKAGSYLKRRQFALAVSESHYAWKLGPDDPDVLDKMIDIHCQAAEANGGLEQYEDAIRWLMCAFGHDESNARTRSLLAERHYLQAQELHRRGQGKKALQVIEDCLRWSPDHAGAAKLQRSLTAE